MVQEPGKEPVAITLADAVNIVNQQNEQIKQLTQHSKEMEKFIQILQNKISSLEHSNKQTIENYSKSVSFSVPIEKPSINTQELLKQKDIRISELETQINNMHKKDNNRETINNAIFSEKKLDKPVQNIIKEKSKLEPEFKIKI